MNDAREQWSLRRSASRGERVRVPAARSLAATACALAICATALFAEVRGTYLYSLSNFGGRVPYDWARIYVDQDRDETYVVYQNLVRIFNPNGMETFSFGEDLDLGQLVDVAVDPNGDIILLSYKDARPLVTRCNFRGVPIGAIEISNLPPPLVFGANRMIQRNGLLYFAALGAGTVIVTDSDGDFREHLDLVSLLDLDQKKKSEAELVGFSVDHEGSIFFTIPVFFRAYKLSPDRKLTSFGRPGSAPGRFGIVAGIASDSRGNVFVADKLKCVVMAFDRDFNFLTEFGTRGLRPENLVIPDDIAIDKRDRLYVTQGRKRGVSVFVLQQD